VLLPPTSPPTHPPAGTGSSSASTASLLVLSSRSSRWEPCGTAEDPAQLATPLSGYMSAHRVHLDVASTTTFVILCLCRSTHTNPINIMWTVSTLVCQEHVPGVQEHVDGPERVCFILLAF
jgi:hypothetical protein